jgi:hypothetical protein
MFGQLFFAAKSLQSRATIPYQRSLLILPVIFHQNHQISFLIPLPRIVSLRRFFRSMMIQSSAAITYFSQNVVPRVLSLFSYIVTPSISYIGLV